MPPKGGAWVGNSVRIVIEKSSHGTKRKMATVYRVHAWYTTLNNGYFPCVRMQRSFIGEWPLTYPVYPVKCKWNFLTIVVAVMASTSELIHLYFRMGVTYTDMQRSLLECHGVQISLRHLKRKLGNMHLFRRREYCDIKDVVEFVSSQMNNSGMLHGYRWMFQKCTQSGIRCRREDVRVVLRFLDPAGVQFRQARRLHRRNYFACGPNFIWHIDSYDKLKPFGICMNGCIDGYSRKVLWLNCYHTNSDPKVIASYFVETVCKLQCCPKLIRTDDGTENVDVLQMQTFFRRNAVDSLGGRNSALTGTSQHNQRIECWWGILRKECVEFWLVTFHSLKDCGQFDGGYIDRNILQFCFMALIQVSEMMLHIFALLVDSTKTRDSADHAPWRWWPTP